MSARLRYTADVRTALVLSTLLIAGCGGGSSPVAPSPAPVVPPTPTTATVTGHVTAVNGGQALGGVSVTLGAQAVTSDAGGAFSSTLPFGSVRVTLTSAGILPRSVTAAVNGARELSVDAIALGGGFDPTFYRQFVRNTFEAPGGMEPLRRWASSPNLYIRTVDDAGAPVDARNLSRAESLIRDTAAGWTGGTISIASIERGTATRVGTAGWLTVRWMANPASDSCGQADVGLNGGRIDLFYKVGGSCDCDGAIRPRTIRHELGHALGYWHTDNPSDLMFAGILGCDALPSARERYHAAIAYARPVGNVDPDSDPASSVLALPQKVVY